MGEDLIVQRPGPSSSRVIQQPAERSWGDPVKRVAPDTATEALQRDPRKCPINPQTVTPQKK